MTIAGIARAFPPHHYTQEELTQELAQLWKTAAFNPERLRSLHENMLVGGRYTALPLADYDGITTFTDSNGAYLRIGAALACEVAQKALDDAQLAPTDIDHVFFVSVTGVGTPSLDTRICNRLGFRADAKRTPIFGLGCVAGAAGLARAADYLRGHADENVLLVSVELCSLTLQRSDLSIAGLIASGLFGDGAAAVVLRGDHAQKIAAARATGRVRPAPRIVATRSVLYPDSEDVLGWDISSEGFKVVLSGQLPHVLQTRLRGDAQEFLRTHALSLADLHSVICHPGGPKVMQVVEECLSLDKDALALTRASLREVGNVSSASVLMILEDTMNAVPHERGAYSLLMAFGPGFCSEMVLLQW